MNTAHVDGNESFVCCTHGQPDQPDLMSLNSMLSFQSGGQQYPSSPGPLPRNAMVAGGRWPGEVVVMEPHGRRNCSIIRSHR